MEDFLGWLNVSFVILSQEVSFFMVPWNRSLIPDPCGHRTARVLALPGQAPCKTSDSVRNQKMMIQATQKEV